MNSCKRGGQATPFCQRQLMPKKQKQQQQKTPHKPHKMILIIYSATNFSDKGLIEVQLFSCGLTPINTRLSILLRFFLFSAFRTSTTKCIKRRASHDKHLPVLKCCDDIFDSLMIFIARRIVPLLWLHRYLYRKCSTFTERVRAGEGISFGRSLEEVF